MLRVKHDSVPNITLLTKLATGYCDSENRIKQPIPVFTLSFRVVLSTTISGAEWKAGVATVRITPAKSVWHELFDRVQVK